MLLPGLDHLNRNVQWSGPIDAFTPLIQMGLCNLAHLYIEPSGNQVVRHVDSWGNQVCKAHSGLKFLPFSYSSRIDTSFISMKLFTEMIFG